MNLPHAGRDWRELTPDELEQLRHAHEVKHCVERGYDWTKAHCAGIVERFETRERAEAIWRDCTAIWSEAKRAARERLAELV